MRRFHLGFTIVELLVALAVAALLAGLAMPAFEGVFERNRVDTDLGELQGALSFTRLEAINHSRQMTLQAPGGDWAGQLTVKTGDGGAGTQLVRELSAMAPGAAVEATNDVDKITFNALGGLSSAASIKLEYTRGAHERSVSVCLSGRILAGEDC